MLLLCLVEIPKQCFGIHIVLGKNVLAVFLIFFVIPVTVYCCAAYSPNIAGYDSRDTESCLYHPVCSGYAVARIVIGVGSDALIEVYADWAAYSASGFGEIVRSV